MSGLITGAALAALITQCAGADPPADLLTKIVLHESGGNPVAIHVNPNGSTDYGLAQINSTNLVRLGETASSILDPCRNIAAEARILGSLSAYNTGSPTRGIANGYAAAVIAQAPAAAIQTAEFSPAPCSETADLWERDACLTHRKDSNQ